jgi:hypothetical protein
VRWPSRYACLCVTITSRTKERCTAQLVRALQGAGADVWVDSQGITADDFVQKSREGMASQQWLLVMVPAALAPPLPLVLLQRAHALVASTPCSRRGSSGSDVLYCGRRTYRFIVSARC